MRVYFFADLETSGLDPMQDRIVEIGWMFADSRLRRISQTSYTPIAPVGAALDRINGNAVVREMHSATGLLDELTSRGDLLPLLQTVEGDIIEEMNSVEASYAAFLADHPEEIADELEFVLAGKNVHFDRAFIDRYMPRLSNKLSYRHLDETSFRYLLEAIGVGVAAFPRPETNGLMRHRAGYDVEVSFTTMRFIVVTLTENVNMDDVTNGGINSFRIQSADGTFEHIDVADELDADLRGLTEEN